MVKKTKRRKKEGKRKERQMLERWEERHDRVKESVMVEEEERAEVAM